MRRSLLHILVGIALVGLLPVPAVRGSELRILGTVVDSEGHPIDGVLVSIQAMRIAFEKNAFTDKKGRFSVTLSDASGEFEVNLTKEGFGKLQVVLHIQGDLLAAALADLFRDLRHAIRSLATNHTFIIFPEFSRQLSFGTDQFAFKSLDIA